MTFTQVAGDLQSGPHGEMNASAVCPGTDVAISGGYTADKPLVSLSGSVRGSTPQRWNIRVYNHYDQPVSWTPVAICAHSE